MFHYNYSRLNSTNVSNCFCKVTGIVKIIFIFFLAKEYVWHMMCFLQCTIVNSIANLHCFHGMYSFLNIICVLQVGANQKVLCKIGDRSQKKTEKAKKGSCFVSRFIVIDNALVVNT